MIKVMIVMYKRADMSLEEFSDYWRGPHAAIKGEWPGVRRYFQNHVLPELPLGDPACDGIAELWFDSQEALLSSLGSAEAQRTLADLANFTDTERTKPVVVDQRVVRKRRPSVSTIGSGLSTGGTGGTASRIANWGRRSIRVG